MHKTNHFILIIAFLISTLAVYGSQFSGTLEEKGNIDSHILMEKGNKWLSQPEGADSALVCFSIVASRYNPKSHEADKKMVVDALRGKWLVYFSYLYDYPKAYEAIQSALDICDKEQLDNSDVRISLAGMLQVMAEMGGSSELYGDAINEYSLGLREAVKHKKYNLADKAFVNLIVSSVSNESADSVNSAWKLYKTIPISADSHRRKVAHVLYKAYFETPLSGAAAYSDSLAVAAGRLPEASEYERLHFIALQAAARLADKGGSPEKAYQLATELYDYAEQKDIRDGLIDASLLMSQILKRMGRQEESAETYNLYLRLKDQMIGNRLIQRLDEMRFMVDLQKADLKLALANEQKKRQTWIILLLSAIVIAVVVVFVIVIRKNKMLRIAHQSLQQQFRLGVATENRERKLREQLEGEKYSGSSLSDTERERILKAILKIVDSADIICSPEFTIAKMAEMAGCNQKYLSQVINEEFGCNFNTFINKYRINEAARRLTDAGEWSRYTIEGIANSVGFKSRSTFVNLFKQFTGSTPSEYKRKG